MPAPVGKTPVTVTEMSVREDGRADMVVARFASWDDATEIARRWSAANDGTRFFQVRHNDGYSILTENWVGGHPGDLTSTDTRAGRALKRLWQES